MSFMLQDQMINKYSGEIEMLLESMLCISQIFLGRVLTLDLRLYIRPRVMKNVSKVDTSTEIFGFRTALPIGIAPSAMQRLAGGQGEIDVAKAAAAMGLNLTLSSQSTASLEEVVEAVKGSSIANNGSPPPWMQVYLHEDVQKSVPLIMRAEGTSPYNNSIPFPYGF